jgi:hypothetical protein
VLGSEGISIYLTVLFCTNVQTLSEQSRKVKNNNTTCYCTASLASRELNGVSESHGAGLSTLAKGRGGGGVWQEQSMIFRGNVAVVTV